MKRSLLALALAAALPFSAQADDKLSNTWIEGDYVNVDGDADGFGVRGSFEFADSGFYGLGGWRSVEIDDTNIDVDNWEFGVGYAHDVSENLDLLSEVAYNQIDVDGFDEDGYRVSVQYKFTQTWGVVGEAEFGDGGESYTLGLRASF
jgi:hypothetical protein